MFKSKTVFILGAGASREVGLPLGADLAARISRKLDIKYDGFNHPIGDGDTELFDAVVSPARTEAQTYQKAGWVIRDGILLADSIDDFLETHQENKYIITYGKAAIAKCILEAERTSSLALIGDPPNLQIDYAEIEKSWFVKLMRMLGREITKKNVGRIFDNISFVNFNYDRCIEHFLFNAIQRRYDLSPGAADEMFFEFSKKRIFHPYGSLGSLRVPTNPTGLPFGTKDWVDYLALARGLTTYSEQIEEGEHLSAMREEIQNAKVFVFLGMQYHEQNMKLLAPVGGATPRTAIGTVSGISGLDQKIVASRILGLLAEHHRTSAQASGYLRLEDMSCAALFDQYARTLPSL